MCIVKNVLHWHIVDTQSFPLEIPSYPKLWDGAYSSSERYTVGDATEIVRYAQRRGINVLAELDVPGHAQSWGVGYPKLWPSKDCQQPLDVSSDFTFKVINGILSDFGKIFKYKFVHLGGDEVNTTCWTSTPRIQKWLKTRRFDGQQAYQYFVLRAQKIALSHGYEIINWEETFNNFGSKLSRKTVVHNWLGGGVAQQVVAAGLRCIVSNQDKWYLDHLDATWDGFYLNEPLANITQPKQQALVLGGEVCMWGENIDASDIEQTIWPRAAAAAERLWTSPENLANDLSKVGGRLAHFRCLLNQRGVAAAPVSGYGRDAPDEPGSCHLQ
nr:beta-hexosaminidase 3 [Ipomoea batatas]